MQDLLWQLKDTDAFTFYTAVAFTAVVFYFIREIVDAPMLALVSAPVLLAGGILAPIVFQAEMVTLAYDKETDLAAMIAIGILTALAVVVSIKWFGVLLLEHQARRARIAPVATRSRPRR